MAVAGRWRERARLLRTETYALALAFRDPETPWYARLVLAIVVAYALCPIDLIPDFIPVLGYLDDLILVPLGIALALRLVPSEVMVRCRARATSEFSGTRSARAAMVVVIGLWLVSLALVIWAVLRIANK